MSKYTKEEILKSAQENGVEFIRLQFTDVFGIMKNVAITSSQLEKALDNECMFDGSSIDGFVRINESDMYLHPDYDTWTIFPWRKHQNAQTARLICSVYCADNETPFLGDPRNVLQKVMNEAAEMGYSFNVGPECEFFLFKLDEDGNPMLNAKGKKILKSSYSVLQDDFFHFMRNAGYTDVERGERGSTEEHLTVTQFKVQAEQQRLEAVTGQVAQAKRGLENAKAATEKQKKKLEALQKETKTATTVALTVQEIETMGKKATFGNNITLTPDECDTLKRYAVNGIIANADNKRLKEKLASAEKTVSIWKQRYEAVSEKYMELKQKAQPFLDALEIASERVRAFINSILIRGKETQEHKHPAQKRGQDMEL